MNIVELILKALSGDTLKQLASVVGESPEGVQKALAAIVPTLLSGIGGLASKPQGAEKLWSTLKTVDDRVSDDLGGVLAGGGAGELSKKGTNILEDLLGKQSLAALIVPLAKFLAGNTELVKKLLPLVAPFLLSMLSKQAKSGGLDMAGLLKLLLSQKGNIASAMPKGLAEGLAGVQGLGDLTSFASSAVNAGSKAAAETTNWLVPGLIAAALAAAGLWFLTQGKPAGKSDSTKSAQDAEATMKSMAETMKNMGEKATATAAAGVEKAKEMVEESVDKAKDALDPVQALTKNFSGYFDSLGGALDGISDEDTAKAAVPALEKFATQFDDLKGLFDKLPEAARGGFSSLLEGGQKTLTEKTDKVLGIPGVGDLLKPLLEGILEKLAALLKG